MDINWYPGHMTKAIRMIEENLKLIDVIIYVLDSRAPYSCINPDFNKLIGTKPIVYVLNKADLGSRSEINLWLNYLSTSNTAAVAIDSTASKSANVIGELTKKLCSEKLKRMKEKGINYSLKAMVLGVPNSGKSTLINNLAGSGKTLTGNKPGVTRGKQWVRVNEYFDVLDTPGTLYPKLTDQNIARHLAYLGSIKDEVVDTFSLSCELIKELNETDPNIIINRYDIQPTYDLLKDLELIGKKRGYVLKGNEIDIERAANAVLEDFRKGRLGALTLDKAGSYDKRII